MTIENFESNTENSRQSRLPESNALREINASRESFVQEQIRRGNGNSDSMSQFGTPELFDSSSSNAQTGQGDRNGTGYGQHVEEAPHMTPLGGPQMPVFQELRRVPKERDENAIVDEISKYLYLQDPTIFGTDYNPLHQQLRRTPRR